MTDFKSVKTYRPKPGMFKIRRTDFARAPKQNRRFLDFYDSLPNILKGKDLRQIVEAIIKAGKKNKPVIFMCGAHVIKCGLNPVVIELIKKQNIPLVLCSSKTRTEIERW